MTREIILKGNGIVVLLILRAVHQRNRPALQLVQELRHRFAILIEFPEIPLTELRPFRGIVAEPLSQRGAGHRSSMTRTLGGRPTDRSARSDHLSAITS